MDDVSGVGSGVLIAVAAALWLVYLVPSWLRKRQYEATERNAVRLQQTLRVLAETAEVPTSVRAEATARGAREQEKIMRLKERERAARARVAEVAAARAAREARVVSPTARARRTRLGAFLALLVGIVVFALQLPAAFSMGIVGATAVLLVLSGALIVAAVAALRRLNGLARARAVSTPAARPAPRRVVTSSAADAALAVSDPSWTPVPIPKPLYLSRSVAPAPATVDTDALAEAAREAEAALRAAQEAPEIAPIRAQPVVPASAPSRFAAMGLIDEAEMGSTDIDEVLRRRRAAG